MTRIGFKMEVYPDKIEDYIESHNPIWTELQNVFNEHGVISYSIFLNRENHILFGYVVVSNLDSWNAIARTEVCQRWWKKMKKMMPTNDDNSPKSILLEEIFHFGET